MVSFQEEKDGVLAIAVENAQAWREWLTENHNQIQGVWLIMFHKSAGINSVYYDEAVDEALCFGWVDSKPNKRDHHSYYQYFAKRNPKSNWSKINKEKVERLLNANKMAPPGLTMMQIAKENGTWNALDAVERLEIPPDLQAQFDQYNLAATHFNAFPRSVKRSILEWIFNAKRPATRAKRIHETASLAQQNIRANQYRQPK